MIRDDDLKVLAELSRLVDRHGPDAVKRLAELIRNPQFADDIATVLDRVSEGAPRRKSRSKTRTPDRVGMGVLNDLREVDSQKHAAVAEFRERLISGSILKTMPEIRRFARTHDLAIGNVSSRKASIVPLLRSISEWETSAITTLLDSMIDYKSDDRSLDRWRDLIVKPTTKEA